MVDKRAQGSPPPLPLRAGLCYVFPRTGQGTGSRACVILGGPACGLASAEGQVDHNGRDGRGEEQWAEEALGVHSWAGPPALKCLHSVHAPHNCTQEA